MFSHQGVAVGVHPRFLLDNFVVAVCSLVKLLVDFVVIHFCRIHVQSGVSVHVREVRGGGLHRLGGRGLGFFACVARRFGAPLSVLVTMFRSVSVKQGGAVANRRVGVVGQGVRQLRFLVGRLLRFHSMRASRTHVRCIGKSVVACKHDVFRLFVPIFERGRVIFRCTVSTSSCCAMFSESGVRGVVDGLLDGTFGRSSPRDRVGFEVSMSGTSKRLVLSYRGDDSCVRPRRQRTIVRPFRGASSSSRGCSGANVKLTLIGNLIRLLSKAIRVRDRRGDNAAFGMGLPLIRSSGSVVTPSRALSVIGSPSMITSAMCLLGGSKLGRSVGTTGTRGGVAMLLIRSGPSVGGVLGDGLLHLCGIGATCGKRRTMRLLGARVVSVVVDSVVVPCVSKCRLDGCVGASHRCSRVPIVLVASRPSGRGRLRNLSTKTSTCVRGPFAFSRLGLEVAGLLGTGGGVHRRCRSVGVFRLGRRLGGGSRRFVGSLARFIVRRVRGPRLDISRLAARVGVDQARLCGGLGGLLGLDTARFVGGVGVSITGMGVVGAGLAVTRVS